MPNIVYFGRHLFVEVKPFSIQLIGSQPIGGRSNCCDFSIQLDSKLFAKLLHHKMSGILIESVSVQYNRNDNVTYYTAELMNVTVDELHGNEMSSSMFISLSFARMTTRAF